MIKPVPSMDTLYQCVASLATICKVTENQMSTNECPLRGSLLKSHSSRRLPCSHKCTETSSKLGKVCMQNRCHTLRMHITQSSPIPSSMCVTPKRGSFGINYQPYTATTLNGMDYNEIRIGIKRTYINQFT